MNKNNKDEMMERLDWYICASLPYNLEVLIDYKGYLEWLPSEIEYQEKVQNYLDATDKTIEDISNERNIICSRPCSKRFDVFRGGDDEYSIPIEFIKPILRPMKSLTLIEKIEFETLTGYETVGFTETNYNNIVDAHKSKKNLNVVGMGNALLWLIKNHFDIWDFIGAGLAVADKKK